MILLILHIYVEGIYARILEAKEFVSSVCL